MAESSSSRPAPPILQGIQPPTSLDLTGKNKATNWKVYKQQWENYAIQYWISAGQAARGILRRVISVFYRNRGREDLKQF